MVIKNNMIQFDKAAEEYQLLVNDLFKDLSSGDESNLVTYSNIDEVVSDYLLGQEDLGCYKISRFVGNTTNISFYFEIQHRLNRLANDVDDVEEILIKKYFPHLVEHSYNLSAIFHHTYLHKIWPAIILRSEKLLQILEIRMLDQVSDRIETQNLNDNLSDEGKDQTGSIASSITNLINYSQVARAASINAEFISSFSYFNHVTVDEIISQSTINSSYLKIGLPLKYYFEQRAVALAYSDEIKNKISDIIVGVCFVHYIKNCSLFNKSLLNCDLNIELKYENSLESNTLHNPYTEILINETKAKTDSDILLVDIESSDKVILENLLTWAFESVDA